MKQVNKSKYNYLLIIISLLTSSTLMIIGYFKLSGVLPVESKGITNPNWNVSIIDISECDKIGEARSIDIPTHTTLTASFNAELKNPSDSIKYKITIKNKGNIDAKLNNFYMIPNSDNNDMILYLVENVYVGEVLKVSEEKEFYVTVKYNNNFVKYEDNKNILIVFEYIQADVK